MLVWSRHKWAWAKIRRACTVSVKEDTEGYELIATSRHRMRNIYDLLGESEKEEGGREREREANF